MNELQHQSLVHISVDLVGGTSIAQELVKSLGRIGRVSAISSVYKRYLGMNRVDLNANIETVLRYATNCAVDELLWHFRQFTRDKKALLNLLSYDDLVVLSPQLTLPHPSLHTDFLIARCASEAWPHYEHPIMQKTLSEIAATALPAVDAEFFLQGKSLVDFSTVES
jgi:7,8-dihydro-6-hydroxymethylpterin-pyrophosphokinase